MRAGWGKLATLSEGVTDPGSSGAKEVMAAASREFSCRAATTPWSVISQARRGRRVTAECCGKIRKRRAISGSPR